MKRPAPGRKSFSSNRSGAAIVMFSLLTFTVVVPMAGLAVDGGVLYLIKAQLQSAVDAAALAGGRSLNVGNDITSQTASAVSTMNAFFYANFPAGSWSTSNTVVTPAVAQTALKTRTATIDATVDAPLYFMRVLGYSTSRLAVHGQSSRRDVNIMLVLDRSSSMQSAGVCPQMVTQARNFVSQFTEARDTLGLITFMAGSNLDYPPNINFKTSSPSLDTVLSQLKCGGNTGSAQALWQAYQQIKAVNLPGVLNLIVFFTDGLPNGITADFTGSNPQAIFKMHTQTDTRYDWQNTGSLVSVGPTSCSAGTATYGTFAQWGGDAATGGTDGVFSASSGAISNTGQPTISGTSGCNFTGNTGMLRLDIAYIPAQDHWGNLTTGYKTFTAGVDTYASGPYAGKVRVDTPKAIVKASINAADNAAATIRNDATFAPVIYTIGLGGTDPEPLDFDFLERVANDPRSSSYNSLKPAGTFVYANDITQLGLAFSSVASQILRLSQ
jgi:Flp pilus assembly protein TadG